jgi:hypothetical protein
LEEKMTEHPTEVSWKEAEQTLLKKNTQQKLYKRKQKTQQALMKGGKTGVTENKKQFHKILMALQTVFRLRYPVYERPNLQRPLVQSVSRATTRLSAQQTPQNPSLQS